MRRSLDRLFGSVLFLLFITSTAGATPINYRLELTVGEIAHFSDSYPYDGCDIPDPYSKTVFQCKPDGSGGGTPVELGERIIGSFQVDEDPAGLADGAYLLPYSAFEITVGMIRYDLGTFPHGTCSAPSGGRSRTAGMEPVDTLDPSWGSVGNSGSS